MKTGSGSRECWPSRLDRILLSKMCYLYKAAAALGQSVQDLGKLKPDEIPAWGEGREVSTKPQPWLIAIGNSQLPIEGERFFFKGAASGRLNTHPKVHRQHKLNFMVYK